MDKKDGRRLQVTQSVQPDSNSQNKLEDNYTKTNESVKERVEKWFINPLNKLNDQHDGFIILMVIFPLYERHLKNKHGDGKFSEGSKLIKNVAKDLELNKEAAFEFWQIFRNGPLHQALPLKKKEHKFEWRIRYDIDVPINILQSDIFEVNILLLKEKILKIVKDNLNIWKENSKIPDIYFPL